MATKDDPVTPLTFPFERLGDTTRSSSARTTAVFDLPAASADGSQARQRHAECHHKRGGSRVADGRAAYTLGRSAGMMAA